MAGFPARKTYVLEFDGPLEGLFIKARGFSVQESLDVMPTDIEETTDLKGMREQELHLFAERITEWNLTDEDDQPLPISYESLVWADTDMVLSALVAWRKAVVGVSAPLPASSPNGEPLDLGSIPMEASAPTSPES